MGYARIAPSSRYVYVRYEDKDYDKEFVCAIPINKVGSIMGPVYTGLSIDRLQQTDRLISKINDIALIDTIIWFVKICKKLELYYEMN